ncbi:S-layer homology domain-containing protein [Paenibacillus arenilitoris]|uniref:S-layer homology domain-containing protein n=1 Tax=Paenibacillus arenilitoris TaxID=2772299 RepID=A0A927CMI4_9BACL|nr:S-layer homology domain-containing protein [Paenibacillus arenilitoris]MBD2868571.1 S-layer homology domain-containing protein [Paenibacillus arenilitoris]
MAIFKRNGLLFLTALLLLSVWSPGTLLAAGEPAFSLKSTNRESKVIIEVKGRHLTDLYAYQFHLAYDSNHMRFIEADSPIPGFTVDPIVERGDILFAHSKIGSAEGTEGDATLAAFTFERITGSNAKFTLSEIKLVDSKLDMIELESKVNVSSASIRFKDIAGHWAESSILRANELGWVAGYSDDTFRPQQQVTRAEFVTMLVRALELPIPSEPQLNFADKEKIPAWARGYVAAAVDAKMIEGYADGTFRAGKLISRAEMASLIVRSEGVVPAPGDKPSFADTDEIPAWAQPYIAVAADRGWIKGVGNDRFAPLKNATRAEAVHLIVTLQEQ